MNIFIAPIGCTKLQFDNFDSPLSLDYVAKLLLFFERTNYQCLFLVFLEGYILLRLSFASFLLVACSIQRQRKEVPKCSFIASGFLFVGLRLLGSVFGGCCGLLSQ